MTVDGAGLLALTLTPMCTVGNAFCFAASRSFLLRSLSLFFLSLSWRDTPVGTSVSVGEALSLPVESLTSSASPDTSMGVVGAVMLIDASVSEAVV
jgi:hypothetical protein